MSSTRTRGHVAAASRALERQLVALRSLPVVVDRAALAEPLAQALRALGEWSAATPEQPAFLGALDAALAHLATACALVAPLGGAHPDAQRVGQNVAGIVELVRTARGGAIEMIVLAQDKLLRSGLAEGAVVPAFFASVGVPSLHTLPIPPPRVAFEDPEDPTLDTDPTRDEPERAKPPPTPPKTPLDLHFAAMGRDCLEDIGMLGGLRRGLDDAPWIEAAGFEQRLLDNLDALAALGWPDDRPRVVECAFDYAAEVTFPDLGRAFALAFVLACSSGEPAATACVLALRQAHVHVHPSYVHALALGSNPSVGDAMRALANDPDPALTLVAVEVLARRGAVGVATMGTLLAHPNPRVAAAAAGALGGAAEPDRAAELLEDTLAADAPDEVAVAAAEALVRLDVATGLVIVRELLSDEIADPDLLAPEVRARAVELLCVAGAPGDLELLLASTQPNPFRMAALGWFGHAGAVPALLGALERVHPADILSARALTRAIHRIAGGADAPDLRAYLETALPKLPRTQRLRYGVPFSASAALAEFGRADTPVGDRRMLWLELAALFPGEFTVDPRGWVTRQQAEISFLRERLGAGIEHAPGEWPSQRIGRRRPRPPPR